MKKRFNEQFEIISMSRASLVLLDRNTNDLVYIHRNAFNSLELAEDYRIVERIIDHKSTQWVEVLVWKVL